MSATTAALRLTDDPHTSERIVRILRGMTDDECEVALNRIEDYLATTRAHGLAFNTDMLLRAVQAGAMTVIDARTSEEIHRANGHGEAYEPPTPKAAAATAQRWTPLDFAALEANGVPPIEWLVQDWIIKHDVFVIAGDAGVGKSTLLTALAYAWATGGSWIGIPVPKLRVLYIDEEQSDSEVYGLFKKHGPIVPACDLRVFVQQGANLDSDAGLAVIDREVADFKPDVLLIDSATQAFGSANSNDNTALGLIYGRLFALRSRHGVTTGFLHHLGKPGEVKRQLLHQILGGVAFGTQASAAFGAVPNDQSSIQLISVKRRLATKPSMIVGYREDPTTGIATLENLGAPSNNDGLIVSAAEWIQAYLKELGTPAKRSMFVEEGKRASHTHKNIDRGLEHLKKLGLISSPKHGWYEMAERDG
jgi:hypothetical protein